MLASHKRKAEVPYIYTSLECLSRASPSRPQRVNVFGIAQNVSVKEENDQILVQFTLLDEKSKIHCRIFTETDDSLHLKASDGCIVRLHRVQAKCVQSSEDSKIILGGRLRTFGLAVVVFRYGPQESPDVVYSSSKNYSIDEEDFKRVADLANFYRNRNPTAKDSHVEGSLLAVDSGAYSSTTSVMEVDDPVDGETGKESGRSCDVGEGDSSSAADSVCAVLTNKRKLQDVVLRQYFDLVAQVIAVFTSDLGNVVVRCWDTTKIKVPPFSFSEDIISSYLSRDQHLSELAAGFSVDVVLYGEHGDKARGKIKAGDIVVMRNLHFYLKSGDRLIVMHDGATGKRFSRGIDVLPSCDMKTMLLHEIEKHEQRPTTGISDLAHPPVVTMQYAPHESRSRMFTAMMITSELKNIVMNKENTFISKNNDAAGCLVKETLEVLLIRLCLFQILESDKNNILPLIAEKCKEDPNANHAQVVKAVLSDSVLKLVGVMHSPLPDCGRKIRQKISRQGNILPEPAFPSSVVFDRLWYTHFSHCLLGYEFRLSR
ncbi:hypothetical protein AB6A40_010207 [Gnathostoma spinigerum]|uniref:Protection of telomeres protein 1 ssDNA-binding domain-containing protein n=1 Tax=Gnathostoma spinigerum TaxID=75299 RepID=A0ABD6EU66_9BILA